ncbi:MAG: family oxidoreductase [Deltaproteobacteria bacterium]|nr:family oxidoreductase [Deltaproteobacteria bacterium]MBP2686203.1 family oxidoreductase [Deltaproteobacteria bacterium]
MGKVTVITGATSGIGKATALLLAARGYDVYAGARNPADGQALVAEAKGRGISLKAVQLDVTDDGSVRAAVSRVARESGGLDNLVNNAGYGFLGTVEEATDAEIHRQFDVNVFGMGRMCRAALPLMRARRSGVIVNISAWLGRMGFPLLTYYNASKYAVEAITDSLRYEVAPFGIRVHSVLPGLFGTRFVSKGLVANPATVSPASPYAALAAKLIPVVAKKINEGPDAVAVAEAVLRVIEDAGSPIRTPVGVEAETFVPMAKQLTDEAFEAKVKEIFGL